MGDFIEKASTAALEERLASLQGKLPAMERERDTLGGESWQGRGDELDRFLARADGQITETRRAIGTLQRELARRAEAEAAERGGAADEQ